MPESIAATEAPAAPVAIITGTAPAPSGGSGSTKPESAAPKAKAPATTPAKAAKPATPPTPAPKAAPGKPAKAAAPAAPTPPKDDEPNPAAQDDLATIPPEGEAAEAPEGDGTESGEGEAAPEVDLSGLQAAIDKLAKKGIPLKTIERHLNADPSRLIELAGDYPDDETAPAGGETTPKGKDETPAAPAPEFTASVKAFTDELGQLGLDPAAAPKVQAFAESIAAPGRQATAALQKLVPQIRQQFAEVGKFIESIMTDSAIKEIAPDFPQMATPAGAAKVRLKAKALRESGGTYGSMTELMRQAAVSAFAEDIAKQAKDTARHQANSRSRGQVGARGVSGSQLPTPRTADEIADWNSKAIDRGMDPAQRRQMLNRYKAAAGIP